MADTLKFVIPGKPEYMTMIRLSIGSIADTAGFNIEQIEDIKTAVAEACKNISCHGSDAFADACQIECIVGEGRMEITVDDLSSDHTIEKTKKPCLDCPNEGNLGFFVIQSLMTKVELIDNLQGKKTIRMIKEK